jgi:hypothetical protein
VEKFDANMTDALDRWSHRRAEVVANANLSAAKQAHYGTGAYGVGQNPCRGYGGYNTGPIIHRAMGTWGYNPWYGFGTYIPCNGTLNSPYGYRMWSPYSAYQSFWAPRPTYTPSSPSFGTFDRPSYNTMGSSSGGYSGTMSSGPSVSASAPAAVSSGSSAASSAGSSSVGHGAASGGGRGK